MTGTNIDNQSQSIIFSYNKSFVSAQLSKIRAKRVLGLAYNGYDGSQNVGYIATSYSYAKLIKSDETAVNYNTSLLSDNLYNNKIFGTAYWPSNKVTYSPTTGDISTQSQIINTTY